MSGDTTHNLWRVCRLFVSQHRYELAVPKLRELLAMEPRHWGAPAALAFALVESRKYDEAVAAAREAVALQPAYHYAHFTLARIHTQREEFDQAYAPALEALRLNPQWSRSFTIPSVVNYELERFELAMEFVERGLGVDAEDQDLQRFRGLVLAGLGREAEAMAAASEFLRTSAGHPWSHTAAGWICWHLHRDEQAHAHLLNAIAINPIQHWSHEGMGIVLARQGKGEMAIGHLAEALRLNPFLKKAGKKPQYIRCLHRWLKASLWRRTSASGFGGHLPKVEEHRFRIRSMESSRIGSRNLPVWFVRPTFEN